jgi:hypothetical protein
MDDSRIFWIAGACFNSGMTLKHQLNAGRSNNGAKKTGWRLAGRGIAGMTFKRLLAKHVQRSAEIRGQIGNLTNIECKTLHEMKSKNRLTICQDKDLTQRPQDLTPEAISDPRGGLPRVVFRLFWQYKQGRIEH